MDWIIGPVVGFAQIDAEEAEPGDCSGGGTLNSCSCTKGLMYCVCSSGLAARPQ